MSLVEIREADAPPGIAAVYAGLREGVGVAQVNLIWRHAAALPGVLDWLWAQVRPALESGAAAGARDRIAAQVSVPATAGMAVPEAVAGLVETYNRGNLTNLAVLTAVRLRAEGVAAGAPGVVAAVGAMLPRPPALPRLADLTPELAAQVRSLASPHGLSDPSVVPSLYLHLSHWPDVLAALPGLLATLSMTEGRDLAVATAAAEAPGLIGALGEAPARPEGLDAFLATLRLFTTEVIPGMIPVGLCLRRAFGRDA